MNKKLICISIVSLFLLTTLLSSIVSADGGDPVIIYNDDGEWNGTFMIYHFSDYVKKTIEIPDDVDLEGAYSVKLEIIGRLYLSQDTRPNFRVSLGDKNKGASVKFNPADYKCYATYNNNEGRSGGYGYLIDITDFLEENNGYYLQHGENIFYVCKANRLTFDNWEIVIDTDTTDEGTSYWHDGDESHDDPEEGELMIRLHIRYKGSRSQHISFFSHFPLLQKLLSFRQAFTRLLILQ